MQIDAVTPDAHRVFEYCRRHLFTALARRGHACLGSDVLFEHRELSLNPSRLANVGVFGQSIVGAHDVGT